MIKELQGIKVMIDEGIKLPISKDICFGNLYIRVDIGNRKGISFIQILELKDKEHDNKCTN